MTLTPESRKALHELLDISLDTPHEVADVMFSVAAHCDCVDIDIHAGGWKEGIAPIFSRGIRPRFSETGAEEALESVRSLLAADSLSEIAAANRRERIATLRAQLETAEKESA